MLRVAFQVLAIVLFPLALAVIAAPGLAFAETLAAWVELVRPGREASIRVIIADNADCPALTADGQPLKMRVRAQPGQMFTEGGMGRTGRANCLTKTAGQSRTADWGATT